MSLAEDFKNKRTITFKSDSKTQNGITFQYVCQLRSRLRNDVQGYYVEIRRYANVTKKDTDKSECKIVVDWTFARETTKIDVSAKGKYADTGFVPMGWYPSGKVIKASGKVTAKYSKKKDVVASLTKTFTLPGNIGTSLPSNDVNNPASSSVTGKLSKTKVDNGSSFKSAVAIVVDNGTAIKPAKHMWVDNGSSFKQVF